MSAKLTWGSHGCRGPSTRTRPLRDAAGEVGTRPLIVWSSVVLPGACLADDQAEPALRDDVGVDQMRGRRVGVGDGDVVEGDHAGTASTVAGERTGIGGSG